MRRTELGLSYVIASKGISIQEKILGYSINTMTFLRKVEGSTPLKTLRSCMSEEDACMTDIQQRFFWTLLGPFPQLLERVT